MKLLVTFSKGKVKINYGKRQSQQLGPWQAVAYLEHWRQLRTQKRSKK